MRHSLLAALLGISLSASAQLPDSVVSRYRRLGFFLLTNRMEPPFQAYKLSKEGSISVSSAFPSIYYLDKQGLIIPGSPFDVGSQDFDSHGYALVKKNNHVGMIDRRGRQVLPLHYEELTPIQHPRQWLAVRRNGRWGLLDTTGRLVVPPIYEEIKPFSNGLAAVKQASKWGFIGEDGQEKIAPSYAFVWQDFSEGFAAVGQADEHSLGFINQQNEPITAFKYDYPLCLNTYNTHVREATPYYRFRHGFALIRNERCEIGVLDTSGREVLPMRFYRVEFTDSTIVGYREKRRQVYQLPH